MPSTSKKQHNFMAAIAHNPAFAKKVGVSQAVGKDFNEADKGRKFKQGGAMKSDMKEDMKMDKAQDKAMIKKAFKEHDSQEHKGGKGTHLTLKKGGGIKKMAPGGAVDPRVMAMLAAKRKGAMPSRGIPMAPAVGGAMTPPMKKGGKVKKMAAGGETMGSRSMKEDVEKGSNKQEKFGETKLQKRGHTKDIEEKMPKFAKGGSISSASGRADGCASRGKTKGRFV